MTLGEWSERWLQGYCTRRESTVKQAVVHLRRIRESIGTMPLNAIQPSHVRAMVVELQRAGLSDSYIYAVHRRLAQVLGDAVSDGVLASNPCARSTSPRMGRQRPYVATTDLVWRLHDAMPEHLRPAILLGAFAGLRISEVCGLRLQDVDFMRGIITPAVQYGGGPLKSQACHSSIPIPRQLALEMSRSAERSRGDALLCDELGRRVAPWIVERALREARAQVPGLDARFRFHDLRHYYASLLISEGLDVKVVQARMRHANATTTLNVYGHMFPDKDETSRAAVGRAMASREVSCAQNVHRSG